MTNFIFEEISKEKALGKIEIGDSGNLYFVVAYLDYEGNLENTVSLLYNSEAYKSRFSLFKKPTLHIVP